MSAPGQPGQSQQRPGQPSQQRTKRSSTSPSEEVRRQLTCTDWRDLTELSMKHCRATNHLLLIANVCDGRLASRQAWPHAVLDSATPWTAATRTARPATDGSTANVDDARQRRDDEWRNAYGCWRAWRRPTASTAATARRTAAAPNWWAAWRNAACDDADGAWPGSMMSPQQQMHVRVFFSRLFDFSRVFCSTFF